MMQHVLCLPCLLALAACGPAPAPAGEDLPTVEALASDPVRLKELRQQCHLERARLGEVLCMRVNEATRKRFVNDGTAPYTPLEDPPRF